MDGPSPHQVSNFGPMESPASAGLFFVRRHRKRNGMRGRTMRFVLGGSGWPPIQPWCVGCMDDVRHSVAHTRTIGEKPRNVPTHPLARCLDATETPFRRRFVTALRRWRRLGATPNSPGPEQVVLSGCPLPRCRSRAGLSTASGTNLTSVNPALYRGEHQISMPLGNGRRLPNW